MLKRIVVGLLRPWLSEAIVSAIAATIVVTASAVPPIVEVAAAHAQRQPQASKKLPTVAYLGGNRSILNDFLDAMQKLGYVPERDYRLETRLTEGNAEKQAQFAVELAALEPDVIVALGSSGVEVKRVTSTIPIVLAATPETIALRMSESTGRPGVNVTGVVSRSSLRDQKSLSFLKAVVPQLRTVAMLRGGTGQIDPRVEEFATSIDVELVLVNVATADDVGAAIDRVAAVSPGAILIGGGALTLSQMPRIAREVAAHQWPSISEMRELPAGGGLMSYGGFRQGMAEAASYVEKLLAGTKPGDLPIKVEEVWELVINVECAKRLGLSIPDAMLAEASEIIRQ